MTTAREVLELIITGDGKQAVTEMKMISDTAKTELGSAEDSAKSMSTQLIEIGGAFAAGGAGVLFGLKKTSDAYTNAARETMKLSRLTGGTAEEMSRLRYVADMTGVGVDTLSTAVGRLSRSSQTAGGKSALAELGVDMVDTEGKARPFVDILGELADRFQEMPNGLEKNAAAMRLFGRGGADLIPLLNRGSEGIETLMTNADRLGMTLSQSDLDRMGPYLASLRELNEATDALKMQVGREVFPIFADGLERAADAARAVSSGLASVPPPLKSAAGALISYTAAGAVAVGTTAMVAGGIGKISEQLLTGERHLNRYGRAAAAAGLALGALAAVEVINLGANTIGGFDRRQTDELNEAVASARDAEKAMQSLANVTLLESKKLKLSDGPVLFASYLGILDQALVDLPGSRVAQPLYELEKAFDMLQARSPEAAAAALDGFEAYTASLDRNSNTYRTNIEFIERSRRSLELAAAAADASADAQDGLADAGAGLASQNARTALSLNRLDYWFGRVDAGTKEALPGVVEYTGSIRAAFDPVLRLADANDRLADAQKRMGEIADTNSREIRQAQRGVADALRGVEQAQRGVDDSRRRVTDATRNLADAQRDLNDVLNDDPMFGLVSQSPEDQLADARNRLAEANRRLAVDKGDAIGLSMRDEALGDIERAIQRRQQLARDGDSRARDIERAKRAVEDAQRGLADAQRGVSDAERGVGDARESLSDAQVQLAEVNSRHGLNSKEYDRAARDVIRATLDVAAADAELAEFLEINGIEASQKMVAQLDEWIARGGPVGAAAKQMKDGLAPLVEQALLLGASLNQVNAALGAIGRNAAEVPNWVLRNSPAGRPTAQPRSTGSGSNWGNVGLGSMSPLWGLDARLPAGSGGSFGKATGGLITGPGTSTSDSIPTMLSNGEYVIRASSVARIGVGTLDRLNRGELPRVAVPSAALPQLPAAARSTVDNSRTEGSVNITAQIQQVVPEPQLAGDAVLGTLRRVAHRSGRGLKVDTALGTG